MLNVLRSLPYLPNVVPLNGLDVVERQIAREGHGQIVAQTQQLSACASACMALVGNAGTLQLAVVTQWTTHLSDQYQCN